jgi:hypothetical protein
MADITSQKVVTGNVINILIKGSVVGLCQTGDGRRSFGTEGVYGIGNFMPTEHVYLRYDGTFTVDRFFIRTADLNKLGIVLLGKDILDLGVLDIEVVDVVKNVVLRTYKNCTCGDYTETFRANAIAGENATWHYLSCVSAV